VPARRGERKINLSELFSEKGLTLPGRREKLGRMKEKRLSPLQIAAKLRAGKSFWIATSAEQKEILTAKRFLGLDVATQADLTRGGWNVIFRN
jgi:hypothetical protein